MDSIAARHLLIEPQVLAHGGLGYAQEYHVERYLRESFVPRIAPVSKVSLSSNALECFKSAKLIGTGNDHELH